MQGLATAEIAHRRALLTPFVPTAVAGRRADRLLRRPARAVPEDARACGSPAASAPTQEGLAIAKDGWLLGIGDRPAHPRADRAQPPRDASRRPPSRRSGPRRTPGARRRQPPAPDLRRRSARGCRLPVKSRKRLPRRYCKVGVSRRRPRAAPTGERAAGPAGGSCVRADRLRAPAPLARRRTRGAAALLALALGLAHRVRRTTSRRPTPPRRRRARAPSARPAPRRRPRRRPARRRRPGRRRPSPSTRSTSPSSSPDGDLAAGTYEITLTNDGRRHPRPRRRARRRGRRRSRSRSALARPPRSRSPSRRASTSSTARSATTGRWAWRSLCRSRHDHGPGPPDDDVGPVDRCALGATRRRSAPAGCDRRDPPAPVARRLRQHRRRSDRRSCCRPCSASAGRCSC